MVVLDTFKNEEDLLKNKGSKLSIVSYVYRDLNVQSEVESGRNSKSSDVSWCYYQE